MIAFLFDNGGTLTDDPFAAALALLRRKRVLDDLEPAGLPRAAIDPLLTAWAEENDRYSFPFACHFLQEEFWIARALMRLATPHGLIAPAAVPELAPRILRRYRAAARAVLAAQPQHPTVAAVMTQLKHAGCAVAVASNDRAFATPAIVAYTGYGDLIDIVVTSEGMSSPQERVEKPAPLFFTRAVETMNAAGFGASHIVYVGDSEANDVETPRAMGFTTVRYINRLNPKARAWLDHRETTAADYSYTAFTEMPDLFSRVLRDLGFATVRWAEERQVTKSLKARASSRRSAGRWSPEGQPGFRRGQ